MGLDYHQYVDEFCQHQTKERIKMQIMKEEVQKHKPAEFKRRIYIEPREKDQKSLLPQLAELKTMIMELHGIIKTK